VVLSGQPSLAKNNKGQKWLLTLRIVLGQRGVGIPHGHGTITWPDSKRYHRAKKYVGQMTNGRIEEQFFTGKLF
jgi:hypothetical protein